MWYVKVGYIRTSKKAELRPVGFLGASPAGVLGD